MPVPTPEAEVLRVREVAVALALSQKSVRRRIQSGELAAIRIGGSIRVPSREVRRLIDGAE